jgi:hypothetical protein
VAQVVEHLPSKCEALTSTLVLPPKSPYFFLAEEESEYRGGNLYRVGPVKTGHVFLQSLAQHSVCGSPCPRCLVWFSLGMDLPVISTGCSLGTVVGYGSGYGAVAPGAKQQLLKLGGSGLQQWCALAGTPRRGAGWIRVYPVKLALLSPHGHRVRLMMQSSHDLCT